MGTFVDCQVNMYNGPLKESEWLKAGFKSLAEYVLSEANLDDATHLNSAQKEHIQKLPLVSFNTFDPQTGIKDQKLVCKTINDLPTSDIPNLLVFDGSTTEGKS